MNLLQVCDTILTHAKERFSFTQHLISATLLHGELFPQQRVKFPDTVLETTVEANPMLNKAKLKTDPSLVYENDEFKACLCTSFSWRTTFRALSQRLSVFSRSSSPHPWQQLSLRGASLLLRGSRPSWETPWHRIDALHGEETYQGHSWLQQ